MRRDFTWREFGWLMVPVVIAYSVFFYGACYAR
jgi:hypothetical protein